VAQRVARQESGEERNRTFWTAFLLSAGMGVLGGIILYFLGHWLFADIFQIPAMLRGEAQKAIPWLAAIVPLIAIISVLAGTLEARQAFPSRPSRSSALPSAMVASPRSSPLPLPDA
jgi:Na+-driven multidrug efflux pump